MPRRFTTAASVPTLCRGYTVRSCPAMSTMRGMATSTPGSHRRGHILRHGGTSGPRGVLIAVPWSVPSTMVQIILETDRGEGHAEVVEDHVQAIAPPGIALHPKVVQDASEVQTDLEADQALAQFRQAARIALRAIGD